MTNRMQNPNEVAAAQAAQARAQAEDAARAAQDAARAAEQAGRAADVTVSTGPDGLRKVITLPGGQQIVITEGRDGPVISGGTGEPIRFDARDAVPTGVVDILQAFAAMIVLIVVGLPIARAFARWLDRRGGAAIPADVTARLANIENAVESIALEVERISEGQRFTAKLLDERARSERLGVGVGGDRS